MKKNFFILIFFAVFLFYCVSSTITSINCFAVAAFPEINLKQGSADIASGGSYDFGNEAVGSDSGAVTFTIENTGLNYLYLEGSPQIDISGTNAADFTVDAALIPDKVEPLGSTTFTVTFAPSSIGAKTATITILSDDIDEASYTVTLNGTGTSSAANTVEMTYLFNVNDTEAGKYVPLVAYIKNIGTEALSATALVEFYVDGPDGFTDGLVGTASAAGLKAGYPMNAYLNWKIPETAPGGIYTYTAQAVDGAAALSEFSDGINFNVASIAAYTAEVLRIMPASATDPAPATLKVLVRNKDTAALTGTVKFYVDSAEVGTAAITNLAAGRYLWYTFSWDTAGKTGSHTYNAQVFNASDAAISKMSSSTGITVY
ncbi:choice-of-anchor D domain-containing protein [Desulfonema limicola]|nr:choice-of-anchor D domain-containing protein [Desulfonema limicola]